MVLPGNYRRGFGPDTLTLCERGGFGGIVGRVSRPVRPSFRVVNANSNVNDDIEVGLTSPLRALCGLLF